MGKLLFTALVVLLGCLGAGFFLPKWLQFMLTMAMANGLVSLGLVILMRGGVVAFGQGLMPHTNTPGSLCAISWVFLA